MIRYLRSYYNETTLHGFKYLTDDTSYRSGRIFWCFWLFVSFVSCVFLSSKLPVNFCVHKKVFIFSKMIEIFWDHGKDIFDMVEWLLKKMLTVRNGFWLIRLQSLRRFTLRKQCNIANWNSIWKKIEREISIGNIWKWRRRTETDVGKGPVIRLQ